MNIEETATLNAPIIAASSIFDPSREARFVYLRRFGISTWNGAPSVSLSTPRTSAVPTTVSVWPSVPVREAFPGEALGSLSRRSSLLLRSPLRLPPTFRLGGRPLRAGSPLPPLSPPITLDALEASSLPRAASDAPLVAPRIAEPVRSRYRLRPSLSLRLCSALSRRPLPLVDPPSLTLSPLPALRGYAHGF